ncbi:MAG TPA: LytTR family DNA-binding domain-containing protein [Chitinophagaceae bacterium]|nr:LytTR family DNA-binding domain-containing protein [Chitinophagaceae bacterium]
MLLKCIAIDDEPPALELMTAYIARMPQLQLLQTFDDAITGAEFLRRHPADLLFVDINMPDITGIELVKSLQEKPMIIFTTAYKKFAYEGFELDAVDYLLKPIDFPRFSKAVTKAIEYNAYKKTAAPAEADHLFVRSEYRVIKINLAEIDFIESLEDYVKIHISSGRPILSLMPLKKVLEKLPEDRFKRIHRSYIVSVSKVRSVLHRKVQLSNGKELPISETYLDFVEKWMNR